MEILHYQGLLTSLSAILDFHDSLKDQKITMNKNHGAAPLQNFIFNNIVLTDLPSYQISELSINTIELPEGVGLDQSNFKLFGRYKSGHLLKLGKRAKVSVEGNFKEVKLQTGEVFYQNQKVQDFFTNRKGAFFLDSLTPGKYLMKFIDSSYGEYQFEVEKQQIGRLKLGEINAKTN